MKRWLISFFFAIATFFVGISLVHESDLPTPAPSFEIVNTESPTTTNESVTDRRSFVAEFHELANFEEFETQHFSTKLIDLIEYDEGQGVFDYRKSDLAARNGEKWLGLFNENGRFSLKQVTTMVRLHHTPTDPDYEAFYTLKFRENFEPPIFVVKGSKSIKPSLVQPAYFKDYLSHSEEPEKNSLRQGFKKQISAFDKNYILRVSKGLTSDGAKVNVLVLEYGNSRQVVTYNHFYEDSTTIYDTVGELLFAGDLDGDQKLDLYISDFGFEKGGFGSQLFLSSEAGPGKLLKLTAKFGTAGC